MSRVKCPNCSKIYNTALEIPEGDTRSIQQIFPYEPAWKREQHITGICSDKCWDEYLGVTPSWREEDFVCPESHLSYQGCIIPGSDSKDPAICPHYKKCDSSGMERWVYTPLK